MSLKCVMYLGDCLDVLLSTDAAKVDMCFADLPYGCTGYHWDSSINVEELERRLWPVISGPVILTGNEPFHLRMVSAWRKRYRYSLIWEKFAPCNYLQAKYRPMVSHEFVGLYGKSPIYNPQKTYGHPPVKKTGHEKKSEFIKGFRDQDAFKRKDLDDSRHPCSILYFRRDKRKRTRTHHDGARTTHPSQKPVALIEWLIRSYTNAGCGVLDPVCGSGSTGLAAMNAGRNSNLIERDEEWLAFSEDRLRRHIRDNNIDATVEVRR